MVVLRPSIPIRCVADDEVFFDRGGFAELGGEGAVEVETDEPGASAVEEFAFVFFRGGFCGGGLVEVEVGCDARGGLGWELSW